MPKLTWRGRSSSFFPRLNEVSVANRDVKAGFGDMALAHELAHHRLGHTTFGNSYDTFFEELVAWTSAMDEGFVPTVREGKEILRNLRNYAKGVTNEFGISSNEHDDVDVALYNFEQYLVE